MDPNAQVRCLVRFTPANLEQDVWVREAFAMPHLRLSQSRHLDTATQLASAQMFRRIVRGSSRSAPLPETMESPRMKRVEVSS